MKTISTTNVLLLVLTLALSCKTNSKGNSKDCAKYLSEIKIKWIQKKNSVYKIENYDLIWNDKLDCIVGKSKNEILNIFGTPSKESDNEMHYFLKNECLKNGGGCVKLTFNMDDNGNVESVPRPIVQPADKE